MLGLCAPSDSFSLCVQPRQSLLGRSSAPAVEGDQLFGGEILRFFVEVIADSSYQTDRIDFLTVHSS
jgi:hypothetical protein